MPNNPPPALFKQAFHPEADAEGAWTLLEATGYRVVPVGGDQKVELQDAAKAPDVFSAAFEDQNDATEARRVLAEDGYEVVKVGGGSRKMKLHPPARPTP